MTGSPRYRVGVDTGGTFTDVVSCDGRELRMDKLPSTPAAPDDAVVAGVRRSAEPTGAMEVAICAMALQRGHLPGTANLTEADPACDLDIIPPGGRDVQATHLLSNAFGFGGINACVAMSAV